jgi:hypothetical protein
MDVAAGGSVPLGGIGRCQYSVTDRRREACHSVGFHRLLHDGLENPIQFRRHAV